MMHPLLHPSTQTSQQEANSKSIFPRSPSQRFFTGIVLLSLAYPQRWTSSRSLKHPLIFFLVPLIVPLIVPITVPLMLPLAVLLKVPLLARLLVHQKEAPLHPPPLSPNNEVSCRLQRHFKGRSKGCLRRSATCPSLSILTKTIQQPLLPPKRFSNHSYLQNDSATTPTSKMISDPRRPKARQ